MEAGLAGCNIVATDRGSTKEYLSDYVWYCNPESVLSIREATLAALETPKTSLLKQHISENYAWEKAAEKTLDVYTKILAS